MNTIRVGADKTLVRPGRKQATATKLGIYSTYFLARCSNFCKSLKKKIRKVVLPTRSSRQQWPPRRTRNGDLSIVFSVQGTDGSPTGTDLENREGDQDIGSPGRPVSSGLQVPGEPGHCEQEQDPFVNFPPRFFLPNALQLHQQRWLILRVDSLALRKIINEEDAVLIPKKSRQAWTFPEDFCPRNFLGRSEPLCSHSIHCCSVSES
jgi:hypothetical protein